MKYFKSPVLLTILLILALSSCKKEDTTPESPSLPPPPPAVNGWSKANLTSFESFPVPGSEECVKYNGCAYPGMFEFVGGAQTLDWVKSHNILAIYANDINKYALKTLRLRLNGKTIDAVVYDKCSDDDCKNCCSINAGKGGLNFLIDMEKYTIERFGSFGDEAVVEWQCLDCK